DAFLGHWTNPADGGLEVQVAVGAGGVDCRRRREDDIAGKDGQLRGGERSLTLEPASRNRQRTEIENAVEPQRRAIRNRRVPAHGPIMLRNQFSVPHKYPSEEPVVASEDQF